jgi:hypothetical protein
MFTGVHYNLPQKPTVNYLNRFAHYLFETSGNIIFPSLSLPITFSG